MTIADYILCANLVAQLVLIVLEIIVLSKTMKDGPTETKKK